MVRTVASLMTTARSAAQAAVAAERARQTSRRVTLEIRSISVRYWVCRRVRTRCTSVRAGEYIRLRRGIPSQPGELLVDGIERVLLQLRRQEIRGTPAVDVISGLRRLDGFSLVLLAELHLELVGRLRQAESGEVRGLRKRLRTQGPNVLEQAVHLVGGDGLTLG